jgi:hypothetical protein
MRFFPLKLLILVAVWVSACDFWPRELDSLAESISEQLSGKATAWLVGGDILVITVAGSPVFRAERSELEAQAIGIAKQAIASVSAPLESIAVTFYAGEISSDQENAREFIFLVFEDRPVLQPYLDVDVTGPLTRDEIEAAIERLGDILAGDQRECVREQVEERARNAGDPELLDPSNVEFLTAETWNELDAFGKRLIFMQAIMTIALFDCARSR